jgi:hypothetical protein
MKSKAPVRTCTEVKLPRDLRREAERISNPPPGVAIPVRMGVLVGKCWHPGQTLTVEFLDGDPEVQQTVKSLCREWTNHINLHFEFGDDPNPDIRISFSLPGSWSYVGTDAHGIAADRPTMNFGWLQPGLSEPEYRRVVLHEFGHALGAVHEHQNPTVEIPWDREAVYRQYAMAPNYWDRETVDVNIFETYQAELTNHTRFDPDSIMLYPIPNELTVGDFEVGWNNTLSELDRELMSTQYPSEAVPPTHLELGGIARGDIGSHGEVDDFWFVVEEPGEHVIETAGATDVVVAVFGPDDPDRRVAQDDDSGQERNARITATLDRGRYEARVWHYWPRGTGEYELSVLPGRSS